MAGEAIGEREIQGGLQATTDLNGRDRPDSLSVLSSPLLVVQELAWNPNGFSASFRSHFNDPVAHIDALQIR